MDGLLKGATSYSEFTLVFWLYWFQHICLKGLLIQDQNINQLNVNSFKKFDLLYAIGFGFNGIQRIYSDTFKDHGLNLTSVHLIEDKLEKIDDGAFDDLFNARQIEVHAELLNR